MITGGVKLNHRERVGLALAAAIYLAGWLVGHAAGSASASRQLAIEVIHATGPRSA